MKTKTAIILLITGIILNSCKKEDVSQNINIKLNIPNALTWTTADSSNNALTWTIDTITNALNCNTVYSIAIDNKGNKWVGTATGISKFDGSRWTNYNFNRGFDAENIICDIQGNIWFSTLIAFTDSFKLDLWFNSRLIKFDGRVFTSHNDNNKDVFNAITIDSNGNKWLGTCGKGLSMFDNKNWLHYKFLYDFFYNYFTAVAIDSQGNKWIGTESGGILKFNGIDWIILKDRTNIGTYNINTIVIDSKQNKWFGTNNGVLKFDGSKWLAYNDTNGLVNNIVTAIAIDSKGNMWFGTNGGISKFNGINWKSYTTSDGLASNEVSCMVIDNEGNIWIGSYGGGVSKFIGI
jgi:ligand-binding sensor domain-containing protein